MSEPFLKTPLPCTRFALLLSMPYLFTCPHCQTQTMVEDQYSGQSGQCVTCGRQIEIPQFSSAPATRQQWSGVRTVRRAVAVLAALLIIGSVALVTLRYGSQGIQTMQENRMRGQCIRNLERIAKAMNAYAKDYGSYPPPVTVAADGRPMHSWRVLILPYLGYQEMYDRFDLEQSWDSMANQEVAMEMPAEYRSPALTAMTGVETSYTLVTGTGTLFPPTGPLGPSDVTDDPAKTLLVVESVRLLSLGMQWTDPADLEIGSLSLSIGTDLGGNHDGGATAAMVDGRGYFLPDALDPSVVRALLTPRGGEGLPDDVLD